MTSPETVDLDDYQIPALPRCLGCNALVIEAKHWRKASKQERQEMLDDDFVRADLDGYCLECRPIGNLSTNSRERMGMRGDSMRVYREMSAQGKTVGEVAEHLGIQRRTVMRLVSQARKRGEL